MRLKSRLAIQVWVCDNAIPFSISLHPFRPVRRSAYFSQPFPVRWHTFAAWGVPIFRIASGVKPLGRENMNGFKAFCFAAALSPAAILAGTVSGKVFQGSGDSAAIADAMIILRQGNTALDTVASGAEGLYSFASVDSGRYTLAVTKAGYQNATGSAFVNGADSTATVNVAMTLIPPPGLVRGTVTDTVNAKVVAGVRIILSRGNTSTGFRDTVFTDAEGKFGFDSVPANSGYTVSTNLAGYVNRSLNNQTIPSNDTLKLAIGIAPTPAPGLVRGTVTDTVASKAVVGARVILSRNSGGGSFTDTVLTDAEGTFAFDSIPANSGYSIAVSATGYVNRTLNNQTVPAGDTLIVTVGIAPPPAPGLVRGTVTDTVGNKPVAGARVILSRFGGGSFNDTVTTDAEGKFGFDSVPANTGYSIAVSATGYVNRTVNNQVVPAADTLVVAIGIAPPQPPGLVRGTVMDTVNNKAVAGARVILSRFGGGVSFNDTALTDAEGKFGFDSVPASTGYTVAVSMTGFVSRTVNNQTVPGADTLSIQVGIAPVVLGTLSIFAADSADSAGLKGASVLARLNSNTTLTGTTGDNGWVSFDKVEAGNYSVTVSLAGYLARSISVTISNGEKDSGEVFLVKATEENSKTLAGSVKDTTSKAVEGAIVTLVISGSGGGQSSIRLQTTTSATGEYAFSGIPASANTGTLTVTKTGFANSSTNVTLGTGATTQNVTLRLPVAIFNVVKARTGARSSYGTWILPQGSFQHLINGRRAPLR
jgi:Carboxypeptidase regulatory-like domain